MRLRDDSNTFDRRLDRLVHFDERSEDYPVVSRLTCAIPKTKLWDCKKWLDQGNEGACVGFGIGQELIAEPAEVLSIDNAYAREKIYWPAQKIDEWPGGSYPGAKPKYEGTSVLAGCKIVKAAGWIDEYTWAFGIDEVIAGVSNYGPCVLGTVWYSGMYKLDIDGIVKPVGYRVGGHCYIMRGVNMETERARCRNSWGIEWGDRGDFEISFDDLDLLLKQEGEAVFFKGRHIEPDKQDD